MTLAEHINQLRVAPRLLVVGYAWLMWHAADWFMALPDPTGMQAAFISTLVGSSAAVFGLYTSSGTK